jgi:glutathione S-transferase
MFRTAILHLTRSPSYRKAVYDTWPRHARIRMLTLFSYPELYGVADNNPYGLKVFAFLRLCGLTFRHEHIVDAQAAPRGQLPYITDDGVAVGDSDAIIQYLVSRYNLDINSGMTAKERRMDLFVRRTLDDLYWVMSYSRWRDPRFWPLFCEALLRTHPALTHNTLELAQRHNFERYHYQGIGRFEPEQVYARGLADLEALADSIGDSQFLFGATVRSADAGIYGFLANIYFYPIETPLRAFLLARQNLVSYCERMHAAVTG